MNAAFGDSLSGRFSDEASPLWQVPLPHAGLTDVHKLASWLEGVTNPEHRQIFKSSITSLIDQMISAGETEDSASRTICDCLDCGISLSGAQHLHRMGEVAGTLGCTIAQALQLLPAFLPKRDTSSVDAINQQTVEMVWHLRDNPALLTWSLNLASDLALRRISNELYALVPEIISSIYSQENLGIYPENSLSDAKDTIADWCKTFSRFDTSSQRQVAHTLSIALNDCQSMLELWGTLKELRQKLGNLSLQDKKNYLNYIGDILAARVSPVPVVAHFVQWSIEVISSQPQSSHTQGKTHAWDKDQFNYGLSSIRKTAETHGKSQIPCEYLPIRGNYYESDTLSRRERSLLSAFVPERKAWVAHPPLSDESRSILFKTLHRLSRAGSQPEKIDKLIEFAKTSTAEGFSSRQVTDFCQQAHRSTFRYYAEMLDNHLVEHVLRVPNDAEAADETRDIYLLELSTSGKTTAAATQGFEQLIEHTKALSGSAFDIIRGIAAFSDLFSRLNTEEPWSQVKPVLKNLSAAGLPFSGWDTYLLSESALRTSAEWKNILRILSVCERRAREHKVSPADRWTLSHLGLSTAFELFSFQAPAHAFRALERLIGQHDLPHKELEKMIKRELISYSCALKRLELSASDPEPASSNVVRLLQQVENKRIRNDGPPVYDRNRTPVEEEIAAKIHRETMRTFQLNFGISNGFPAQRFSCQHVLDEAAQTAQFVEDCRGTSTVLLSRTPDLFPGSGYHFHSIDPEALIPKTAKSGGSRTLLQKHFPYLKESFNSFSDAQFIFLRGAIIVIPPASMSQRIQGTPYSLIIYNEHFSNTALEPGHFVPSEVILSQLEDLKKLGNGAQHGRIDPLFEIDLLRKISQRRGLRCLNLCWGSNLNTGLHNSFPPHSNPFFGASSDTPPEGHDSYGNPHKQYRLQKLDSQGRAKFLATLQQGHSQVYAAFSQSYGYLQTFQVLQAAWNRGFKSNIEKSEHLEYSDRRLLEEAELPLEWAPALSEAPLRQLRMAINYHLAYRQGWAETELPVLASCDAESYATTSIRPLMNPITLEILSANNKSPVSIKDLPLDSLMRHWNELNKEVSGLESQRHRFQDLRWVQSSFLERVAYDNQQ